MLLSHMRTYAMPEEQINVAHTGNRGTGARKHAQQTITSTSARARPVCAFFASTLHSGISNERTRSSRAIVQFFLAGMSPRAQARGTCSCLDEKQASDSEGICSVCREICRPTLPGFLHWSE